MKNTCSTQTIICFGEILWDVLPSGKRPGGAPMNVAYHLHKLGINTHLISSIGKDTAGEKLLDFLKGIGLSTVHIQGNKTYPTSEVLARVGENHEVTYDIVYPVAWDYINWEPAYQALLGSAAALIFGSLGSRNLHSRETLLKMLDYAQYRVFDINIREPHYTPELVTELLQHCDLVKVNANELNLIAQWYDHRCLIETDCVELLFERFEIKEILITKGSQGATYHTRSYSYDYPAYPVNVADTVGSGDSFLAAFLAMKLTNEHVEDTLDYAVAMGAFITSQTGACPQYSKFDLDRFIWKRKMGMNDGQLV
ncbi:carbohydrate kinase [Pedobacter sp. PAMC26386]|nr:carbohydrate kinase [Pedobacter sp. PAMC26386]